MILLQTATCTQATSWSVSDAHPTSSSRSLDSLSFYRPLLIQVKFYRPTTGTLLKSAYDYLLHNLSSSSPSSSSPEAAEESDDVVARLLAVKHDRVAWRSTLGELYSKGYRPELVFIDAGLVTCLDETNRRNFLDLYVSPSSPLSLASDL